MKKKKFKIYEGDVFTFRIESRKLVCGQVLGNYKDIEFLIVIFDGIFLGKSEVTEDSLKKEHIALIGITLDAKFYNSDWEVIMNTENVLPKEEWPKYEVLDQGNAIGMDFYKNETSKHKSDVEIRFRNTYSPKCFEVAIQSYFKNESIQNGMIDLLYSNRN